MNTDTIVSLSLVSAENYPHKHAFNYFDRSWKTVSYREFLGYVKAIASHLIESGVKGGDRIAIVSENRFEWCASYLGIVMSGCTAVPIDAQLGASEVGNLLTDSSAVLVFHSLKTETNVTVPAGKISFDSPAFRDIISAPPGENYPDVSEDDLASIVYTSGTTGKPKGVMLTQRNFCSDAKALMGVNIVNHGDNVLSILPLHHTYSFMCTFLVPLFIGATITYPPGMKGPELVATMKEKGVTILVAVPQLLELIRNGIMKRFEEMPAVISFVLRALVGMCGGLRRATGINVGKPIFLSAHRAFGDRFRFFASGGARLDPLVMQDLEALGFTVLEGYGLTETSPVVTFNPIEKRKPGSAGKPLPSVEIEIVNPASGTGEGEIAIRGPMVMKGYYNNPEETAEVFRDGWFMTGDLGYPDSENYLFITGRAKEIIVLSSGKNVYPEDAEKEYLKIPLIREVCVTGMEERGALESLHALIVPDLDHARKERIGNVYDALKWEINKVSMTLPPYMRVKGFTLYPNPLPRTPLGKLKRFMIKDLLKEAKDEAREKREEDEELSGDETGRRVVECIMPLLREKLPVRSSDNLELDLGFDSLRRIELVVALESAFSLKLPETFASEIQTVGELVLKIKDIRSKALPEGERPPAEDVFSGEIAAEERKRIGLDQGRIGRAVTSCFLSVIRLIFRCFFRLRVAGTEDLPAPPFIIAPNHSSNLDGFVVASALPQKTFRILFFQGFQIYFTGRGLSLFGRLAHAIPIDPESYLGRALKLSSYILRSGKILCIFPEGGRSFDGKVMPFKKGVGILAIRHNVPVVPVLIQGTFEALPRGSFCPKRSKVKVVFGSPLYPSELDLSRKPEDVDEYQFFADEVRERAKNLYDY